MNLKKVLKASAWAALGAMLAGCGGGGGGGGNNNNDDPVLYVLYFDADADENILAAIDPLNLTQMSDVGGFKYQQNTVFGLDRRPDNNQLYAYCQDNEALLRVNKSNGDISVVGQNSQNPPVPVGIDFDPVNDNLRVVALSGTNFRVNPSSGSLIATDVSISSTYAITDIAYSDNFDGATVSTLFGIDAKGDSLVRIGGPDGSPSPNGGSVTVVGPLGISLDETEDLAVIDIDGDNNLWMIVSAWTGVDYDNRIYLVNRNTGAATFMTTLPNNMEVVGLTANF